MVYFYSSTMLKSTHTHTQTHVRHVENKGNECKNVWAMFNCFNFSHIVVNIRWQAKQIVGSSYDDFRKKLTEASHILCWWGINEFSKLFKTETKHTIIAPQNVCSRSKYGKTKSEKYNLVNAVLVLNIQILSLCK